MIQVLNQIEALHFARHGYTPWALPYERKTYLAGPDDVYRGGLMPADLRGSQV